MTIYSAPLQGYTGPEWRHLHASMFGGVDRYCSPFLRVEKGTARPKDVRAISVTDGTPDVLPQILFRDIDEFRILTDAVIGAGHTAVDLNLGCPFPPQVKHGRGAALLRKPGLLGAVAEEMRTRYPQMTFSVKMRLGVSEPDEWLAVMPQLTRMPLSHIAVHPRVATQQYGGDLRLDEFGEFLTASPHPVIYNGDILSPTDYGTVTDRFPTLTGIMIGRGLLTLRSGMGRGAPSRVAARHQRRPARHLPRHTLRRCPDTLQNQALLGLCRTHYRTQSRQGHP